MIKMNAVFMVCLAFTMVACGQITTKVKVVDEEGNPVEGAEVKIRYIGYKDEENKILKTDKNGFVEDTGKPELRLHVYVNKKGYYQSLTGRLERTKNHDLRITLRKRVNPIALYVKKAVIGVPKENKWFGYDLELGDLVNPHGKGKRSDLFLKVDSVGVLANGSIDPKEGAGKFWIRFPNTHEGFIYENKKFLNLSQMKMPHEAPNEGYASSLSREEKSYHNELLKRKTGIFLRVRVEENAEGEIEEAHYAKITSDIFFDPRETGWHKGDADKKKFYGGVRFTYYFNPTPNDRNLEFDPERNLFKDLPHREQVRQP